MSGLTTTATRRYATSPNSNANSPGLSPAPPDDPPAALLEQAREHLAAIEAAARKLDAGTYDRCDVCGKPIGAERLAARPAALTCVRCAARR